LLVDDNAINQKVAVRILQQFGYQPEMAANGREALDRLDRQPFDFIFMDVMMPEMDGLEATRVIRERQADSVNHPNYKTPIIIVAMTANAMQGDREKCLAAGMDDYIAKPVRPEDVRTVLERWGSSAASADPKTPVAAAPAPASAPAATAKEEPPVDLDRLKDLTDGNEDNLRELVELYIKQTALQMEQLQAAVKGNVADEVRRVAHSCAGASATCGITRLVPLLRDLEQQGYEGRLTNAAELAGKAVQEFEQVRAYLTAHVNLSTPPAAAG
jgi:CheY-like chemotaxis protein